MSPLETWYEKWQAQYDAQIAARKEELEDLLSEDHVPAYYVMAAMRELTIAKGIKNLHSATVAEMYKLMTAEYSDVNA